MTSDELPSRIGRYEVEALIGEGATAFIYRGLDPAIGRTVAIKLLKSGPDVNEEYLARFQREAQSAGAISHPNIVTIYDAGRHGHTSFITMEYLDEKSLADVSAGETLSIKQIIAIGIQLALALDHAHAKGIVHRDIKPENVLLLKDKQTVKLTDFGIARLKHEDNLLHTHAGAVLGTPRYMSPEQALGRETDGRSDLFSLGAILYELLGGRKAFDSSNLAALMLQIVQENPTPLRSLNSSVTEGLHRLVHKLLAKKPEQRFQNGKQVADALETELQTYIAKEQDATRNRYLPLRVKLAAVTGAVLAALFLVSMGVIYQMEARVVRKQALTSGVALTHFVAEHSAVAALDQNWLPLKLFVQSAKGRGTFDSVVVADHDGIVQAATDSALIGKTFRLPPGAAEMGKQTDTAVFSFSRAEKPIYLFAQPILFQRVKVGEVFVGLDQSGAQAILRATLWMMAILGLLAVLAVVGLSRYFALLILPPLRLLERSLDQFAGGDLDRRLPEDRHDEIGTLFRAFNRMANEIQLKSESDRPPVVALPLPGISHATSQSVPETTVRLESA